MIHRHTCASIAPILAIMLVALPAGCQMSGRKGMKIDPFSGEGRKQGLLSREQLATRLMSFADRYLARMAEATDKIADQCQRVGARERALTTRYYPSLAVVSIAADPQPEGAVLDMVTVVTLERMVWAKGWAEEAFGEYAPILTEAQKEMEDDIWSILADVLPEPDRAKLRGMLEKWLADNPNRRYVTNVRFDEFATERGPAGRPNFSINFGPSMLLAPVDDTARAVTETRQLGERMTFLAARLPMLIGWQSEMVMCQLMSTVEFRSLVADADRVSLSAAQLTEKVKTLPEDVAHAQRQVIAELDSKSKNIVEVVEKIRLAIGETDRVTQSITRGMGEWKQATDSTRNAAVAIDGMLNSADKLSARWKSAPTTQELMTPPTGQLAAQPLAAAPNATIASAIEASTVELEAAHPFDIRDYGQAATQLADAARELNRLADNTDKVLDSRAIDQRLAQLNTSTNAWVDYAFRRGVQLILISAAAIFMTVVLLRLVGRRSKPAVA